MGTRAAIVPLCALILCSSMSLISISWLPWEVPEPAKQSPKYPFTATLKIINSTVEPLFVVTRNPEGVVEEHPALINPGRSLDHKVTLLSREKAPYQLIMIGFSSPELYEFAESFITTHASLSLLKRLDKRPIAIVKPRPSSTPRKQAHVGVKDFDLNDNIYVWHVRYY